MLLTMLPKQNAKLVAKPIHFAQSGCGPLQQAALWMQLEWISRSVGEALGTGAGQLLQKVALLMS